MNWNRKNDFLFEVWFNSNDKLNYFSNEISILKNNLLLLKNQTQYVDDFSFLLDMSEDGVTKINEDQQLIMNKNDIKKFMFLSVKL